MKRPKFQEYKSRKLELSVKIPTDWQKIQSKEQTEYPMEEYVYPIELDYDPHCFISRIEIPPEEQSDRNFQELSNELMLLALGNVEEEDKQIIARQIKTINNCPARMDIFVFFDPAFVVQVTQYQVCYQFKESVCGFIGIVQSSKELEYLPIFQKIAESIKPE